MSKLDWDDFDIAKAKKPAAPTRRPTTVEDDDDHDDDQDLHDHEGQDEVKDERSKWEALEVEPSLIDSPIKFFRTSNEVQILVTEDRRVCCSGECDYVVYELPIKGDDVANVFLDPEGTHCLVTTEKGENFYINTREPNPSGKGKPKRCDKLKGLVLTAVGWYKKNESTTTSGAILLGTADGKLHETRLEKDSGAKYAKLLYDIAEKASDSKPITGLEVEVFPFTTQNKMLVMATTHRMYQFIGGPDFERLFSRYADTVPPFSELPATQDQHSELAFWRTPAKAKTFAWTTGVGLFHGRLHFLKPTIQRRRGGEEVVEGDQESAIKDTNIIPYLFAAGGGTPPPPLAIAISEYRFYILYPDKLLVLGHPPGLSWASATEPHNKLKPADIERRIDFRIDFPQKRGFQGLGLCRDPKTGNVYVYTALKIWELACQDEDRNVWGQFLERAMDPKEKEREAYFRRAERLCGENYDSRQQVLRAKAEYYFSIGRYEQAAAVSSKTDRAFEEIALQFISVGQREALLQFLLERIRFIRRRRRKATQESMQLACLCTWVVEMYLDRLNQLSEAEVEDVSAAPEREAVSADLQRFLQENKEHLDSVTTFALLSSHGQTDEVLYFAELMHDYERVITHHIINSQRYDLAIKVLTEHCLDEQFDQLWYQFSPNLIQHHPQKLVAGWMLDKPSRWLVPSKLIPALSKYDAALHNPPGVKENQAVLYLEWLVHKKRNADPSMHNMLLSLYAQQRDDTALLQYLQDPEAKYDPKYALRLCLEGGKTLACVHIYSAMGLYEDAVLTALQAKNMKLARENAEKPGNDDQLKKKLWLEIVKFVVREQNDVKKAIALLKETEYIKLEDILPFFPDFVLIQDFKDEICASLEDYNHQIEDLKLNMDEATHNADAIRSSIKELRHRYGYITATQPCDLCQLPVLSRDFYLFPSCRHVFHQNCLHDEVKANLSREKRQRVQELERVLHSDTERKRPGRGGGGAAASVGDDDDAVGGPVDSPLEQARKELENLITSECIFCSDFMIETIDKGFAADPAEEATWAIES